MDLRTKNGYSLFIAASALQKAIRRNEEEDALFWALELHDSNFVTYLWRRMRYVVSEDIGLAEPNLPANFNALYDSFMWHRDNVLKNGKGRDDHGGRLILCHAVLLLSRARKSRIVDDVACVMIERMAQIEKRMIDKPEVKDYVYDKHTSEGRRKGRGMRHFYEEGAVLEPHDTSLTGTDEWHQQALELGDFMDANGGQPPSKVGEGSQAEPIYVSQRTRGRRLQTIMDLPN